MAPAPPATQDAAPPPPLDRQAIARLADRDPRVREQAALDLSVMRDRRAVELLVPLLGDADEGVRGAVRVYLAENGRVAVEPLITALQHADPRVRAGAAGALFSARDPRAIAPLVGLLQDPEPTVRASAVSSLSYSDDPRAADAIVGALDDPRPEVRRAAIAATRDPRALPHVLDHLDGRDQMTALEALVRIHDVRAVAPLIRLLKTARDDYTRQRVSHALAAQGEHALPPLQSALERGGDKLRRDAARALAGIKAPAAGNALLAALQKQDLAAVAGGAEWLCRQRDARPDPVLIAALDRHGDVELAGTLLNCGTYELREAAATWAERRGYEVQTMMVPRQ
jgi:HEAT repeat protein